MDNSLLSLKGDVSRTNEGPLSLPYTHLTSTLILVSLILAGIVYRAIYLVAWVTPFTTYEVRREYSGGRLA